MIRSQITIINKLGLHARAASKLVRVAADHASDIQLAKDGKWVDGKSIMQVMMLAASQDSVLEVQIDGDDEQQAWQALCTLIDNRFDEGE